MLVSGSVGYTLFEKNNKKIIVFADVHDGVDYCKETSESMSEYLNKQIGDSQILLEETIPSQILGDQADKLQLTDLWPNSKHTQELKKFANDNSDNIKAIDIRPILIPFSWELIEQNKKLGSFIFADYIKFIDNFFKKKHFLFEKIINTELNKLVKISQKSIKKIQTSSYYLFLPLVYLLVRNTMSDTEKESQPDQIQKKIITSDNIDKTKIIDHLDEIHEMFLVLKIETKKDMDKPLSYFIVEREEVLHKVNYILSLIMEWYMILLISNIKKDTIIHTGLAHSSNLVILLEKYYKYNKISQTGVNDISQFEAENMPISCVKLPADIGDKFNKKFGLNF